MIIDANGTVLIPGNNGRDCEGNGENKEIECCCDECGYYLCCVEEHDPTECDTCDDKDCPRSQNTNGIFC